VKREESATEPAIWRERGIGGEAGIRTLLTRFSNVVMARDFWRQGFESQSVTRSRLSSQIFCTPPDSSGGVETMWRRPSVRQEPLRPCLKR
jgi:hypothetical protein